MRKTPAAAERRCPDCSNPRLVCLGGLPDVGFFAGRPTPQSLPGGALWRCSVCDLRFRWPLLSDYERLYDNDSVTAWTAGPLRKDQRLVQALIERQPSARSVLDFGCYSGEFLEQLPAQMDKYGIEVSSTAAELASRRAGASVVPALKLLPPDLRFDIIVAMDVIEHVASPRTLLQQLIERLAPNGSLVVTTGDGGNALWRLVGGRWWYCYFPEHIAFISRRWLAFHVPSLGARIHGVHKFNYEQDPERGIVTRWWRWLKYLMRPAYYARKRAQYLVRHDKDLGVPGQGLTRDHLLVHLRR